MVHLQTAAHVDRIVSAYEPRLVMVSGPSASGKTEVVNALTACFSEFQRPRSYTTRPQRRDEPGSEYVFVDRETFESLRSQGEFLNCDVVYGHRYAMTKASVSQILDSGNFAIKEIHPESYAAIDDTGVPTIKVLLLPADRSEWQSRLIQRDPDRIDEDVSYFDRLNIDGYDIIRYVWPGEKGEAVAESLRRALLSHAHFGHAFPAPAEIDRANKTGYDEVSAEFSDAKRITTSNFHSLSVPFFEAELADIPEGSSCLEIGPGRGWLRQAVTWPRVDYSALDLSSSMSADTTTMAGSARAIPWSTEHFDFVIASLADPFLYPTALAEINRVLKPGGRFIFSTPSSEWSDGLRSAANRQKTSFVVQGNSIQVYSFTFRSDELTLIASVAGFRVVRLDHITGAGLVPPISPAITDAARTKDVSVRDLRILHTVVLERVS